MDFREHLKDIELEISSRCTLGCMACPRNYQPKDKWYSGFMDFDVLKDIVENSEFRMIFKIACFRQRKNN